MNVETRLEGLGYKQELTRSLSRLTNYGTNLSVVSISSGMITGGPAVMVWGWITVSLLTFFIAAGMAEICSAYPTAGGLYFWIWLVGSRDGSI
jgi:amino acid transporter